MTSISSTDMSFGDRIQARTEHLGWLNVSRVRAFLGHLGLSAFVVSCVFAVIFLVWYPRPYFEAVGAWSIIRILVGVDLVLGPLLTLIVFKPGKRLLVLDVAVIAIVQLSALTYGLKVLHEERPYYAVFAIDRIQILAAKDVPDDYYVQHDWMNKPFAGPMTASARRPATVAAQQQLIDETLFGGAPDIESRPEFWVPLYEDLAELRRKAHSLDVLRATSAATARRVDDAVADSAGAEADLGFLPIASAKNHASAIVDLTSGDLIAVLQVDPWSALAAASNDASD